MVNQQAKYVGVIRENCDFRLFSSFQSLFNYRGIGITRALDNFELSLKVLSKRFYKTLLIFVILIEGFAICWARIITSDFYSLRHFTRTL